MKPKAYHRLSRHALGIWLLAVRHSLRHVACSAGPCLTTAWAPFDVRIARKCTINLTMQAILHQASTMKATSKVLDPDKPRPPTHPSLKWHKVSIIARPQLHRCTPSAWSMLGLDSSLRTPLRGCLPNAYAATASACSSGWNNWQPGGWALRTAAAVLSERCMQGWPAHSLRWLWRPAAVNNTN